MFLFANEGANNRAWMFYTKRGFGTASQSDSEIMIREFIDHPILSSFPCNEANLSDGVNLSNEASTFKLLCLNGFDSFQFGCSSAAKTPLCFLLDPYRPVHAEDVDNPMVFAQFPGKLSLKKPAWNSCSSLAHFRSTMMGLLAFPRSIPRVNLLFHGHPVLGSSKLGKQC